MHIAHSLKRAVAALAVAAGLVLSLPAGATASVSYEQASGARLAAKNVGGCPGGGWLVFDQNIVGAWHLKGFGYAGGTRCATVYNGRGNSGNMWLEWTGSHGSGTRYEYGTYTNRGFGAEFTWLNVRARVNDQPWTASRVLKW